MRRVRLSPGALADLDAIHIYIARHNPAAADDVIRRIQARILALESEPFIGQARPELRPDLRNLVVGNYLVFYLVADDLVEIVRVLHGAQDLPTILGTGQ